MKAMDHRIRRQTDLLSVRCTVLDMMCNVYVVIVRNEDIQN